MNVSDAPIRKQRGNYGGEQRAGDTGNQRGSNPGACTRGWRTEKKTVRCGNEGPRQEPKVPGKARRKGAKGALQGERHSDRGRPQQKKVEVGPCGRRQVNERDGVATKAGKCRRCRREVRGEQARAAHTESGSVMEKAQ